MKIALTVSMEEPVPPKKYGGTELVVANLAREYTELGHDVYLLAAGNSQTPAHLVPIVPVSIREMPDGKSVGPWRDYWKYTGVAKIIEELHKIKPDMIHNNLNWRLVAFENVIPYPMMSTLHGPLTDIKERETYMTHPEHPYISISNNQRKALPDINWADTVYNGIDLSRFPFNSGTEDRDYFVFLGRTSPEKGLAEIVKLVRETKHKLKIAAKVDEVDQEYFTKEVRPYVDGTQIEFLGELDHKGKTELMKKAKALLLWLNWEEPFGLVVPEANACGTPVIVNKRGSMPELVQNGVNGFLVSTQDEMKQRLDDVGKLHPADCRERVEKHFSSRIMAENYLKLAEKVIQKFTYA